MNPTPIDLGAAGIITAELFAVEVVRHDGSTSITRTRYRDFDEAEERAAQINAEIEGGVNYWWTQAYVVTADGSEV